MTATVLIGVCAMILLVIIALAALHIIRQSVSESFRALERIESRNEKSLQTVLDRLMTIKWEDFAAVQAVEEPTEGGFFPPGAEREGEEESGGVDLSQVFALRERLQATPEEQELLNEDFPEEMGVRQ